MTDLTARTDHDDPRLERTTAHGRYTVDLDTDRWWWSEEVFDFYGFAPHEVVPSTGMLLAHLHPDEPEGLVAAVNRAAHTGVGFAVLYRIRNARREERLLNAVGDVDPDLQRISGHIVDLTSAVQHRAQRAATDAIQASARSRATIEQAVGAVAVTERLSPVDAFARLRTASNDANVPIRTLATAITEQLPYLGAAPDRLPTFLRELTAPAHRS